jgi:hypothetical protein
MVVGATSRRVAIRVLKENTIKFFGSSPYLDLFDFPTNEASNKMENGVWLWANSSIKS